MATKKELAQMDAMVEEARAGEKRAVAELTALRTKLAEARAEVERLTKLHAEQAMNNLNVLLDREKVNSLLRQDRAAATARAEAAEREVATWKAQADKLEEQLIDKDELLMGSNAEQVRHRQRADEAEKQIREIIDQYGDPEEEQTLAEVFKDVHRIGEEGWGRAGEELEKWQKVEQRSDELAALVEVQRLAGNWQTQDEIWPIIRSALATTPAAAPCLVKAAGLREMADNDEACEGGSRSEIAYLRKKLIAEAERLEAGE